MPRSIRGRMILISALAILLSLLIAGWALAGALEGFVTRGLDQRLDSEITLLATAIDDRGAVERSRIAKVRGLLEAERDAAAAAAEKEEERKRRAREYREALKAGKALSDSSDD